MCRVSADDLAGDLDDLSIHRAAMDVESAASETTLVPRLSLRATMLRTGQFVAFGVLLVAWTVLRSQGLTFVRPITSRSLPAVSSSNLAALLSRRPMRSLLLLRSRATMLRLLVCLPLPRRCVGGVRCPGVPSTARSRTVILTCRISEDDTWTTMRWGYPPD